MEESLAKSNENQSYLNSSSNNFKNPETFYIVPTLGKPPGQELRVKLHRKDSTVSYNEHTVGRVLKPAF